MSKPLKKTHYQKQEITQELLERIEEVFGEAYDDRKLVGERHTSLRKMAEMVRDFQSKLEKLQLTGFMDCDFERIADDIWKLMIVFEGCSLYTYKGLQFCYHIKGNEMFVDRKENSKSITKSSVVIAAKEAMKLRAQGITDFGPKKLKVFGASYLWAIFRLFMP